MFKWCIKGSIRVFLWDSMVISGSFQVILIVFKGILKVFKGCVMGVSKVIQGVQFCTIFATSGYGIYKIFVNIFTIFNI